MVTVNDTQANLQFVKPSGVMADQLANEMRISLFTYWIVMSKRICDNIPMIIRYYFDKQISNKLFPKLTEDFADANSVVLAVQEKYRAITEERKILQDSIARLQSALKQISIAHF